MSADPGKTRPIAVSLHVTVLGTGTMGQGIAQVAAQSGHTTRLFDAAEGRALAAVKGIGAQLEKLLAKGKITADQRHQTMNRLSAATDARDACAGADVVIEAVPEDMAAQARRARSRCSRCSGRTRSSARTPPRSRSPSSARASASRSARSASTSSTRRR